MPDTTPGICPKCNQDATPYTDVDFSDEVCLSYTCTCGVRFAEYYALREVVILDEEDLDEEREDDEP